MKNDVCIKAGSYCPICKGVVLADCRHDSIQFSVPMRYQRMEFNAQLQNEVKKLTVQRDELAAALEKLARLGNEPHYGNSIGNQIAIEALAKVGAGDTATEGHNDRVEGRDAALSRRVPSHDGLCGAVDSENGT